MALKERVKEGAGDANRAEYLLILKERRKSW